MFSPEVDRALEEMGFSKLTRVQERVIPLLLERKNVVVQAKTGSGKTAAFGIPIVELGLPSLVLSPTRELARQTACHIRKIGKYKGIKVVEVYGGVGYKKQIEGLKDADVVVATPGRLIDLWSNGVIDLNTFRIVIIDEADLMLDMGFIDDVSLILSNTNRELTGLFSATIPIEIEELAKKFIKDFEVVRVCLGLANVTQKFIYVKSWRDKVNFVRRELDKVEGVIIFVNTRKSVEKLAKVIDDSVELRGDLPQSVRNRNIDLFRKGVYKALITTDVASRGLDIPIVNEVINFDIPRDIKTYIHRIGRTGRMGREGVVVNLLSDKDKWFEDRVKGLIK